MRSRSASLEDNVVVYGTELRVFGKQYQCMLKTGRYDLILQEVGSKFSTQDCLWEKAAGKRVMYSSVPIHPHLWGFHPQKS